VISDERKKIINFRENPEKLFPIRIFFNQFLEFQWVAKEIVNYFMPRHSDEKRSERRYSHLEHFDEAIKNGASIT
jgi:hypothetical protein